MDIFEELNSKLKKYEIENFKGWLHMVARNHCLMHFRDKKNLKTTEFNPAIMQSGQDMHPEAEHLQKEENFTQLEKCIEKLPGEQRQSIELFYLQNKCYNEITAITGYDWNKVRSHIQNGKRNLKICMEEKSKAGDVPVIKIFK